jgi:hypothetical protein
MLTSARRPHGWHGLLRGLLPVGIAAVAALLLTGCGATRIRVEDSREGSQTGTRLHTPPAATATEFYGVWIPEWTDPESALVVLRDLALRGTPADAYACHRHALALLQAFPDDVSAADARRFAAWSALACWSAPDPAFTHLSRNARSLEVACQHFRVLVETLPPGDRRRDEADAIIRLIGLLPSRLETIDLLSSAAVAGWRGSLGEHKAAPIDRAAVERALDGLGPEGRRLAGILSGLWKTQP